MTAAEPSGNTLGIDSMDSSTVAASELGAITHVYTSKREGTSYPSPRSSTVLRYYSDSRSDRTITAGSSTINYKIIHSTQVLCRTSSCTSSSSPTSKWRASLVYSLTPRAITRTGHLYETRKLGSRVSWITYRHCSYSGDGVTNSGRCH